MTSLVFMLVLVPAPPWMTPTTNWSCSSPVDDPLADRVDEVGLRRLEDADVLVGARRRLLDAGEGDDEVGVVADRATRDREVDEGPRGVDAPVDVLGDLHRPEGVALGAGGPAAGQLLGRVVGAVGGDVLVTVDELLGHRARGSFAAMRP